MPGEPFGPPGIVYISGGAILRHSKLSCGAVEWGCATHAGGLFLVLGESLYRTGHIEESKDYYLKPYCAYLIIRNTEIANIIQGNINLSISNM